MGAQGDVIPQFPYDYVYFKAWEFRREFPLNLPKFPYDYVYFKAKKFTMGSVTLCHNFHTITSILKHGL